MLPLHLWKIPYPFQTRIGNLKLKIRDIFSLQAQEIWALGTTRPQIPRGIKHNPVTFFVILCLVVICLKIGEHHPLQHKVKNNENKINSFLVSSHSWHWDLGKVSLGLSLNNETLKNSVLVSTLRLEEIQSQSWYSDLKAFLKGCII